MLFSSSISMLSIKEKGSRLKEKAYDINNHASPHTLTAVQRAQNTGWVTDVLLTQTITCCSDYLPLLSLPLLPPVPYAAWHPGRGHAGVSSMQISLPVPLMGPPRRYLPQKKTIHLERRRKRQEAREQSSTCCTTPAASAAVR